MIKKYCYLLNVIFFFSVCMASDDIQPCQKKLKLSDKSLVSLHKAAENNEFDYIRSLLDEKTNVNVQDDQGQTLLHIVLKKALDSKEKYFIEQCMDIIDDIGKYDPDTTIEDDNGETIECLTLSLLAYYVGGKNLQKEAECWYEK